MLIKKQLTAGEQREIFARMIKPMHASVSGAATPNGGGDHLEIDTLQTGLSRVLAYLVDWSLVDGDGKPVVIRHQPIDVVTAQSQRVGVGFVYRNPHGDPDPRRGDERRAGPGAGGPLWRSRIVADLAACRVMHWTLPELLALPVDVYDVLMEELGKEFDRAHHR